MGNNSVCISDGVKVVVELQLKIAGRRATCTLLPWAPVSRLWAPIKCSTKCVIFLLFK